jgi:hypothetical protein
MINFNFLKFFIKCLIINNYILRQLEMNAGSNKYIAAEGSGSPCRIKVVGVGGGGGNAVNR